MFKIELLRYRYGERDSEEHEFNTREEAQDFARICMLYYGYRAWLNDVELNKKDFKGE